MQPQTTSSPSTSAPQLAPQADTVDALCGEHGPFQARVLDTGFGKPVLGRCPQCAAEAKSRDDAIRQREDVERRERRVAQLRSMAGIPARFATRNFDGYRAEAKGQRFALAACRALVDAWPDRLKDGASLVLTGGPGTGKTHLACAIANAVMEQHLATVAFGTVATILRHVKDTYRKDSDRSEQQAIEELVQPDLLVLDEVGVQIGSEHEKLLMFEILNARYQECRPTILISNLAADELEQFLGQRVMDRYRECGVVLGFSWASHRGQQ